MEELLTAGLLRLDVEFGNASGFYSATRAGAFPRQVSASSSRSFIGDIKGHPMDVADHMILRDQTLARDLRLTTGAESSFRLFDMVSRFVVLSDNRPAYINGREIRHCSSNIYYQYDVDELIVPIGQTGNLKVQCTGTRIPPGFESVFYIRDEAREPDGRYRWIVHHRVIVKLDSCRLIVRSCNPRFEGPLPFQWLIPKSLKRSLFRIRERRFPGFPLMSVGEIPVAAGFTTRLATKLVLFDE